jgi:hypothetical protein
MFCMLLFNFVNYVLLLLCLFWSGYSYSLCCSVYCWCVNVYCTLPPGVKLIAVNKYIIINISINKREAWLWLSRTAETCKFLDYYIKVLCMDGLLHCIDTKEVIRLKDLTPVCPATQYSVPLNSTVILQTWTPRYCTFRVWTRACNTSWHTQNATMLVFSLREPGALYRWRTAFVIHVCLKDMINPLTPNDL